MERPANGDLSKWAAEGVFLLNASLTVRACAEPMSHAKIGWAQFTDAVIRTIAEEKQNVVFLLWGNSPRKKQRLLILQNT